MAEVRERDREVGIERDGREGFHTGRGRGGGRVKRESERVESEEKGLGGVRVREKRG